MKKFALLIPLISALTLWPAYAATNLVTNPGFETGDFSDWTHSGNPGFTSISGGDHSGSYGATFGPVGSLGYLSQDLHTMTGAAYTIEFWLDNWGGAPNDFTVDFGGEQLLNLHDDGSVGWTRYTYLSVASGPITTLTFGFRHDPSFFALDDVSVVQTPEPASFSLLAGALAFVGFARLRKR